MARPARPDLVAVRRNPGQHLSRARVRGPAMTYTRLPAPDIAVPGAGPVSHHEPARAPIIVLTYPYSGAERLRALLDDRAAGAATPGGGFASAPAEGAGVPAGGAAVPAGHLTPPLREHVSE